MSYKLKLGGHLSARMGLRHVVVNARAMDFNLVQIMLAEPGQYVPTDIPLADVAEYRKMAYGIETIVHLPYTINPCEDDKRRRNFYRKTFREFCASAAGLGVRAVVLHPGFKKTLPLHEAHRNLVKFLEDGVDEDWHMDVLIETDAGSKNGSAVGDPEFIQGVLDDLAHPRLGMVLDTEHLYARGFDLWNPEYRKIFLEDYGHSVRLVHLNVPDSNVSLGSFLDRHNTPFEERLDLAHTDLILDLLPRYPTILERSSLVVQGMDANYVRRILTERLGKEILTQPTLLPSDLDA